MTKLEKEWYRPREIARLRLITNSVNSDSEDSNRYFILKLIRQGKLKAKDYGTNPAYPYYVVHRDEIERYNKERG